MRIGDDEFDEIPQEAVIVSEWLTKLYEQLGKPQDPFCDAGQKLMKVVIDAWQDLYPLEAKAWIEERKTYKLAEMDAREQVMRQTGRSLASYPFVIFQMMKKFFPDFDPTERENCIKMVEYYPIFQFTNKK